MAENISFTLEENIGLISENGTGWTKELNLVSWNGNPTKFDIREWAPDHDRMSRGITLNEEEAIRIMELLADHFDMILLDREYDEEEV